MATTGSSASIPYEDPSIMTILILTSFLFLLNKINHVLDRLIYCGLLGQILVGIAWGTPGLKLLHKETEHVIMQLGYLGLILLVYEGGLNTSFFALKSNLWMSIGVAITGIALPIGFSFVLMVLVEATALQGFAVGAALCSTSLGTTFTIMGTSGLRETRLGVVLTTAAMLDDVVGLVMVQVIAELGSSAEVEAATIVRPVGVSLALAVVVVLLCRFVVLPVKGWISAWRSKYPTHRVTKALNSLGCAFLAQTAVLLAMAAGASYAGTSNLFAAYLAGASTAWWGSQLDTTRGPHQATSNSRALATSDESVTQVDNTSNAKASEKPEEEDESAAPLGERNPTKTPIHLVQARADAHTGIKVFDDCFKPAMERILKPFFFVGISISVLIPRRLTSGL